MDVRRQRRCMAVIVVEAERLGIKLVGEALARLNDAAAELLAEPVHPRRVDAVKVDRMRVLGAVDELDAQALALAAAQRRPGHAPVVGPGRELRARGDLDLLVLGHELPLAQHTAVRKSTRLAHIEVAKDVGRIEAVGRVIDSPPRLESVAGVAVGGSVRCGRGWFGGGRIVPRVAMGHERVSGGQATGR